MTKLDQRRLAKMFRALSNPNRLRLFTEIFESQGAYEGTGRTCFLSSIMDRLNIQAPTVSHHLKELVEAELVHTDREGKFVTCSVNPKAIEQLRAFLGKK